ncbi:MAG: DUF3108 domain-containing protein [Gammaproteobacteria bacterium]
MLSTAAPAGDDVSLDFQAQYALYYKGIKVAEMQRRFSRAGNGAYRYRSETEAAGLFALFRDDKITEESWGRLGGDTAQPLHYQYIRTGSHKQRNVSIRFDWDKNEVINQVNGSAWKMKLEPGMVDKLLYQFIIMLDLGDGKRHLEYVIADGGKTKTYRFDAQGEEVIQTPLGKMRTLKLRRYKPNSRRETTLWCAPALHYLPVKVKNVEKDDRITVAIIQSLKGLGR